MSERWKESMREGIAPSGWEHDDAMARTREVAQRRDVDRARGVGERLTRPWSVDDAEVPEQVGDDAEGKAVLDSVDCYARHSGRE